MLLNRIVLALASLLWLTHAAFAADMMVMDAVARASLVPTAKTGAIYFTLMNHGAVDDKLLSATSPASETVELHETQMDGDVMKMRAIEGGVALAAGATVEFKTGGMHVMLVGLKAPLKEGDTIQVELNFEKAGMIKVDVPVGKAVAGHDHGG
jgi:periplasmic copper chaperone A